MAPSGTLQFQQVPIADVLQERPFLTLATEPLATEEATVASLALRITAIENLLSNKVFEVNQSIRDLSKTIEGRFAILAATTADMGDRMLQRVDALEATSHDLSERLTDLDVLMKASCAKTERPQGSGVVQPKVTEHFGISTPVEAPPVPPGLQGSSPSADDEVRECSIEPSAIADAPAPAFPACVAAQKASESRLSDAKGKVETIQSVSRNTRGVRSNIVDGPSFSPTPQWQSGRWGSN